MNTESTKRAQLNALWKALIGLLRARSAVDADSTELTDLYGKAQDGASKPEAVDPVKMNSVARICAELGLELVDLLHFVQAADVAVSADTPHAGSEVAAAAQQEACNKVIHFQDHPLVTGNKLDSLHGLSQKQLEEWVAKMTPGKSFPDKDTQNVPSTPNPWKGGPTPGG